MIDNNEPVFADLRLLRLDHVRMLLSQSENEVSTLDIANLGHLQSMIDALCDLSLRDALTGVANRSYFLTVLERELDRSARTGESCLLLVIDIDHFKRINDTLGQTIGDELLKKLAHSIRSCIRPMDILARCAGEEFALILPNCESVSGLQMAQKVLDAVSSSPWQDELEDAMRLTISIGGAFAPEWIRSSASLWMERAQFQLYMAKSQGRHHAQIEHMADSAVSAEEKTLLFGALSFDYGTAAGGLTNLAAGM